MIEYLGQRETPFHRSQESLAKVIANTPPGERLPSEPKLSKQLGVSRATLREAMRAFEGQGIIRRRQGVGTFVISHTHVLDSGLEILESIETMAHKISLSVTMGKSKISYIQADAEQALVFNIKELTPLIQIERVILADERPVAFLIDILSDDILEPSELAAGFTGSVLDFLIQRGTPKLANSVTDIQAVTASSEVARLLGIQRSDALLFFQAKLFTQVGQMVDLSSSYFLPGYFNFHVIRRIGQN